MSNPEVLPRTVVSDPVTRFVRALPGEWFMLREVSHAVGVSQFTLRRYIAEDIKDCLPSKMAQFGKVRVYLYSREDIERIQYYLANQVKVLDYTGQGKRAGRPPVYTKEERQDRRRLYSRKWYWDNRAEVLSTKGDVKGSEKAMEKVREIEKELSDSGKR